MKTKTEWNRGGFTKEALIKRASVLMYDRCTDKQARYFAAHLALMFHAKTLVKGSPEWRAVALKRDLLSMV